MALSNVRRNYNSAIGLGAGGFTGDLQVVLFVTNPDRLTFNANVTFNDTVAPFTFTPSDDNGKVKNFQSVDDVFKWLNQAFFDVQTIDLTIDDATLISKVFVPATDPVASATRFKARFMALKTGLVDNAAAVEAKRAAAQALGWDVSSYAAEVANYNELVAQKAAILAMSNYYQARVDFYDDIINP